MPYAIIHREDLARLKALQATPPSSHRTLYDLLLDSQFASPNDPHITRLHTTYPQAHIAKTCLGSKISGPGQVEDLEMLNFAIFRSS